MNENEFFSYLNQSIESGDFKESDEKSYNDILHNAQNVKGFWYRSDKAHFIIWLTGFLESQSNKQITVAQLDLIKLKMQAIKEKTEQNLPKRDTLKLNPFFIRGMSPIEIRALKHKLVSDRSNKIWNNKY